MGDYDYYVVIRNNDGKVEYCLGPYPLRGAERLLSLGHNRNHEKYYTTIDHKDELSEEERQSSKQYLT